MIGATYIEYDRAMKMGKELINDDDIHKNFGLLIICGINLGCRIGDLLRLTFADLQQDSIIITEEKTKKNRILTVNQNIKDALVDFEHEFMYHRGGKAFVSQKGTVYSRQHVNRLLKKYFSGNRVSTHSLKKSFGRRYWEKSDDKTKALAYLGEVFNHSDVKITKRYLGIRDEEIAQVYVDLV